MVAHFGQAEMLAPKREFDNTSRGKAELLWNRAINQEERRIPYGLNF